MNACNTCSSFSCPPSLLLLSRGALDKALALVSLFADTVDGVDTLLLLVVSFIPAMQCRDISEVHTLAYSLEASWYSLVIVRGRGLPNRWIT